MAWILLTLLCIFLLWKIEKITFLKIVKDTPKLKPERMNWLNIWLNLSFEAEFGDLFLNMLHFFTSLQSFYFSIYHLHTFQFSTSGHSSKPPFFRRGGSKF